MHMYVTDVFRYAYLDSLVKMYTGSQLSSSILRTAAEVQYEERTAQSALIITGPLAKMYPPSYLQAYFTQPLRHNERNERLPSVVLFNVFVG
jgi:hypothetical protein